MTLEPELSAIVLFCLQKKRGTCMHTGVCVCVCVCEREREREIGKGYAAAITVVTYRVRGRRGRSALTCYFT